MGFFSFLGRVLFASIFILSAWQMFNEFGEDGGPAAKEWAPKLGVAKKFIDGKIGKNNLYFDVKAPIFLIGNPLNSVSLKRKKETKKETSLFLIILYVLIMVMYILQARTFVATCIFLKGFGGLLFVLGSSFGAFLLIFYLILTTPMLYDFHNYDIGEPKFFVLLREFLQCVAFAGALLFFLGMKNSILRKQQKKKAPKPKAA